jgi:serine/threonine protein kinase
MTAGGPETHIIDGRFELRERLGGGGMGLVWRAYDLALQREVALKEVRAGGSDLDPLDPQEARMQRERVLREARALARLQHPNVVTIHHIVDSPEVRHPWLVMELVSGGSLADLLERGPLGPSEAARLGRGVLSALAAAHAAGIQHRDVKPANVLVRMDGTPVLTDFGIAALQDAASLTATGTVIGSPEYMAPERIRGREGDSASDLWSLGMLLYTAVEGGNPMSRTSTLATLAAVLDQPIPQPQRAGALTPVLGALLRRDPAQRPPADVLDGMLAHAQWAADRTQPIPGPPPGMPIADAIPIPNMTAPLPNMTAPMPTGPGRTGQSWSGQSSTGFGTGPNDAVLVPHHAPAKNRRPIYVAAAIAAAVAVLGATVFVTSALGSSRNGNSNVGSGYEHPTASPGSRGASSTTSPSQGAIPPAPSGGGGSSTGAPTLSWMQTCISALEQAMKTTKVVDLTIYSDYADADAPLASDPNEYNEYDYIHGSVTTSTGSTVDDPLVDINSVQWDTVPGLFAQADAQLKVPDPIYYYVILDSQGGDNDTDAELLIYEANAYGGGYIHADLTGNIIDVYPMSS